MVNRLGWREGERERERGMEERRRECERKEGMGGGGRRKDGRQCKYSICISALN